MLDSVYCFCLVMSCYYNGCSITHLRDYRGFDIIHTTMAGISIEMPAIVLVVYKEAIILHCLRGKD